MALPSTFQALRVQDTPTGPQASLELLTLEQLPPGDTLLRVEHSSLNYKDGLAVLGRPGILKGLPMTPGIDLAGEVLSCETGMFMPGQRVLLTGWGTGERRDGGYAELARVQAGHLLPLPPGTDTAWAMSIGTAGLTAMLAVLALEQHGLSPQSGEVLVTGAAGGVGSLAVSLLSKVGFEVVASTGRPSEAEYLRQLGASRVIDRGELSELKRPLESERWAGVIDNVGGSTLAGALASTKAHGVVVSCGLAGGSELHSTVFPFILRGVTLAGIDSNTCPMPQRQKAWSRLAELLLPEDLAAITQVHDWTELPALAPAILAGQVRGRVLLRVSSVGPS